jgi:hypothetical protein
MREQITEFLATVDPLFVVAALASFLGILLYYTYGGFINENYTRIKWFRRLFLPHITRAIKNIDKQYENVDMSGLYVETNVRDREHVFDLYLDEETTKEQGLNSVGGELISNHFRPEVILASLATNPEGEAEDGNFVLTAPSRNHTDVSVFGRIYDIMVMFISKYQLHVRIYYDEDKHKLEFYAHHEMNPYNPLYAERHFEAKEFNVDKGVEMFKEYKDDMNQYGVELVE